MVHDVLVILVLNVELLLLLLMMWWQVVSLVPARHRRVGGRRGRRVRLLLLLLVLELELVIQMVVIRAAVRFVREIVRQVGVCGQIRVVLVLVQSELGLGAQIALQIFVVVVVVFVVTKIFVRLIRLLLLLLLQWLLLLLLICVLVKSQLVQFGVHFAHGTHQRTNAMSTRLTRRLLGDGRRRRGRVGHVRRSRGGR